MDDKRLHRQHFGEPPIRALLIERSRDDALVISELLASIGRGAFVVDWVSDTATGILRVHANDYDVCLLGPSNGTVDVDALAAADLRIPVVLLSADGQASDERRAILAGASGWLPWNELDSGALGRGIRQAIELAAAIKSLRDTERLQRAVLDGVDDAILVADDEGHCVDANAAACKMFGENRSALLASKIMDLSEDPEQARAAWADSLAYGSAEGEWIVVREHQRRILEYRTVGNVLPRRHVLICRDVTDARAARSRMSAADRMASVGTLAAGVAHEINNPLTAVISNLELLKDEITDTGTLDLLSEARRAAELVRQIVRDLKVFSRSDEKQTGPLALQRVVESSLRMAWSSVRHRARVVESYDDAPLVEGNESRLAQVFLNLIVNAAQSLPETDEDHQVRISLFADGAGNAVVEVSDTGAGIPKEVLPHVFEPFFTTKPIGVGTGLGLAICDQIVHAMNGHIEIDSKPGSGTTVRVILPGSEGKEAPPPITPRKPPIASRRGHVLVIDDEEVICHAVQRILSRAHEVVAETSAEAALERIRRGERYDVILCDLMMPKMSGMDFHAELSQHWPELAAQVVFVTGGAFTERALAFLNDTENLLIDKPFDPIGLIGLVNELVG